MIWTWPDDWVLTERQLSHFETLCVSMQHSVIDRKNMQCIEVGLPTRNMMDDAHWLNCREVMWYIEGKTTWLELKRHMISNMDPRANLFHKQMQTFPRNSGRRWWMTRHLIRHVMICLGSSRLLGQTLGRGKPIGGDESILLVEAIDWHTVFVLYYLNMSIPRTAVCDCSVNKYDL
jgi:hypothetical protein